MNESKLALAARLGFFLFCWLGIAIACMIIAMLLFAGNINHLLTPTLYWCLFITITGPLGLFSYYIFNDPNTWPIFATVYISLIPIFIYVWCSSKYWSRTISLVLITSWSLVGAYFSLLAVWR